MKTAMTAMALVLLAGGAASAQEREREGREGRGDRAERAERRDIAQRDGEGRGDRQQDAPRVRDRSDGGDGERGERGEGGPRGEDRRERPEGLNYTRPVVVPEGGGVLASPERPERWDRPHRRDPDEVRRERREHGQDAWRDGDRRDDDRRDGYRGRDGDRPGFAEPDGNRSWDRYRRGDPNWGRRWSADERRRWRDDDRDRDRRRGDYRVWSRGHHPFSYASRNRYRVSIWIAPSGYYSRYWRDGDFLPYDWYGPRYRLNNWWSYDLPWPPPGYDWVRIGDDVLLVDRYSGRIVQVVRNIFW